jgi:hypothetical protein
MHAKIAELCKLLADVKQLLGVERRFMAAYCTT